MSKDKIFWALISGDDDELDVYFDSTGDSTHIFQINDNDPFYVDRVSYFASYTKTKEYKDD